MDYFFGRKEETNGYSRLEGVWIEADTLEFAIYKFAYADNDIYKYLSDYSLSEYNYELRKYVLKDGCYDKAEINIYAKTDKDSESELVKTIKISELENFNFDDIEKKLSSKGQKADSQEIALVKEDTVECDCCLLYLGSRFNYITGWRHRGVWYFDDNRNSKMWQDEVIAWKEIVLTELKGVEE